MKKITIVLICLIMLLNSIPAFATDTSNQENDMPVVVSLGDSYSSGEGVQPYYGQKTSDKHTCEDWIAHRSSCAWPGLLQYNGKYLNTVRAQNPSVLDGLTVDYDSCKDNGSWYFTAVSGAVTKDIISMQYVDKDGKTQNSSGQEKEVQKAVFHDVNKHKLNLQIDTVKAVQQKQEIDYITMTIGGNDVGFADIMKKSVMTAQDPSSTPVVDAVSIVSGPVSSITVPIVSSMIDMSHLKNKLVKVIESFWDDDSDSYSNRLKKTYEELLKAAPSATLVIAGYPQLLHINEDGSGNGGFFSYEESRLIDSAVLIFNDYLDTVVKNLGTERIIFADVMSYFQGHEAYADDPYIKGIVYGFDENINFTGTNVAISSASFHPNEKGVYAYASAVQEALAKIDSGFAETYYSTDSQLMVYDTNGEIYDNYVVEVNGKEYKDIIGGFDFWGLWKQDYHKTFTVTEKQPLSLNLPKGNYIFTITDSLDTDKKISKPIKIRENNENTNITIVSNFGKLQSEETVTGYYDNDDVSEPIRTTSSNRDIVLVLDVSGSMSGTPMEETKKASTNFVSTILKEDASIGIVTYDDSATMLSDFSTNEAALKSITEFIDDGGGTNIESGLQMAKDMLSISNAEKKIIVLMSDGAPNAGKVGDELIEYADSIKEEGIYIYTLGFFSSMGSSKSSAQLLMEGIASDGCHYEVADADDLVFFFGDIADQINGQKFIYVRIACPVDVTVTYLGESLSSSEKDFNDRTSFGALSLEDIEDSDDKIKTLRLKEGKDYAIKINGTGRGKMDYTIGYMDDSGEYSDMRNFRNIDITRSTVIDTSTKYSDKTILNVDEDGDGKYDLKFRAGANEYGELVDYTYIIYIALGVVGAITVLIAVLVIRKKIKKRKAA